MILTGNLYQQREHHPVMAGLSIMNVDYKQTTLVFRDSESTEPNHCEQTMCSANNPRITRTDKWIAHHWPVQKR
jgi:hypothetical protein